MIRKVGCGEVKKVYAYESIPDLTTCLEHLLACLNVINYESIDIRVTADLIHIHISNLRMSKSEFKSLADMIGRYSDQNYNPII